MFQLLRYDCENGINVLGYYCSRKEAYKTIFSDVLEWSASKKGELCFPKYEDISPASYDDYIYLSRNGEPVGACYSDGVALWDDFDTWYQIIELPSMKMDNAKIEAYADTIRTIISFLRENEEYGDDWSEEIKNLDSLLDEIK